MLLFFTAFSFLHLIIFAYPSDFSSVELSFKRLESGESSGEIVNQCCQREPKYVTVGYGISDGEVRVDVGQCRQKCLVPAVKPLKREEFDKYLKKYPDMDPIQIFLSLQSKHSKPTIEKSSTSVKTDDALEPASNNDGRLSYTGPPSGNQNHRVSTSCLQSTCSPTLIRRENYYDLSGVVKEVDVIESCDCLTLPHKGCQRTQSMVKIHVDTPFEKTVNVGQCLGSCDDSSAEHCLACRPVRNRTISIDGPNGSHCLQVIDDCQCVGECYRVRKFLKVYDYTHVFTTSSVVNGSTENFNENSNNNSIPESGSNVDTAPSEQEPLMKVIDIGRCSGSCTSDAPVASKCLLWSNARNGTCLSYLSGKRSCTPTKFVSHSYTDKSGKKHTVVSVTGCGCR